MIVFSLYSLIVSILVFLGVNQLVFMLGPTNPVFAQLLVVILGTAIVSLLFTVRQFRALGKEKWRSPLFHRVLLRTFLINFVVILIISMVL